MVWVVYIVRRIVSGSTIGVAAYSHGVQRISWDETHPINVTMVGTEGAGRGGRPMANSDLFVHAWLRHPAQCYLELNKISLATLIHVV